MIKIGSEAMENGDKIRKNLSNNIVNANSKL